MNRSIPLSIPNFIGNEKKYVEDAVQQGWVSTGGEYVNQFEKMLSQYLHVEDVAVCQSGTSGLHLSLIDTGICEDDMVIVPTLTFIAAVNPVKYQSAAPIFIDCDDSLCMDPEKVERFCEEECKLDGERLVHRSGKCVRAIIIVHVFGNLADMEKIMEIAKRYHLIVIEDATEALGTRYIAGRYSGMYAGTIGDYGVYSFNGNKIITTGGGGAVTARRKDKVEHIRYLSTQAKDDSCRYIHNEIGYNYRMTNVQAAIGVAQLEKLEEFIQIKDRNYLEYKKMFEHFEYGIIKDFRKDIRSNKWFYSFEVNIDILQCRLIDIIRALQERGIQTRAIWELIHLQKPYCCDISYEIEHSYYYSRRILNLPCSTQLKQDDLNYVTQQLKEILKGCAKIE